MTDSLNRVSTKPHFPCPPGLFLVFFCYFQKLHTSISHNYVSTFIIMVAYKMHTLIIVPWVGHSFRSDWGIEFSKGGCSMTFDFLFLTEEKETDVSYTQANKKTDLRWMNKSNTIYYCGVIYFFRRKALSIYCESGYRTGKCRWEIFNFTKFTKCHVPLKKKQSRGWVAQKKEGIIWESWKCEVSLWSGL